MSDVTTTLEASETYRGYRLLTLRSEYGPPSFRVSAWSVTVLDAHDEMIFWNLKDAERARRAIDETEADLRGGR